MSYVHNCWENSSRRKTNLSNNFPCILFLFMFCWCYGCSDLEHTFKYIQTPGKEKHFDLEKCQNFKKKKELPCLETSIELQMLSSVQVNLNCLCHVVVLVIVFLFVFVSIIVFLLVRSYFLITLSKCFKGHKCLGSLFVFQNQKWLSYSVSQWQGHLLRCPQNLSGQIKADV